MQYSDEALLQHYALRDRAKTWVRANFIASFDGAATRKTAGAVEHRVRCEALRRRCARLPYDAGRSRGARTSSSVARRRPHLFGSLVEADCIDELCLTLSPVLESGNAGRIVAGAAQTTRRMRLGRAISVGEMLMLRYEPASTADAPS
jgi:hypothetical protein